MHTDHYFTIGLTHASEGKPCEDYAISGMARPHLAYAIVSDGCSGAQAHTDIGARTISWAFQRLVEESRAQPGEWFDKDFERRLLAYFEAFRITAMLPDYLATIVGLVATPEKASVYIYGDGAIAVKYLDGRIELIELSWWDNKPLYLAYQFNLGILDEFVGLYKDSIIEPFKQVNSTWIHHRSDVESITARFSLEDVSEGHVIHFNPSSDGIESISIFTDGIDHIEPLSSKDVVDELMSFTASNKGSFVKRRAMRALDNLKERKAKQKDDFAMATIWFGPEKVNDNSKS